MLIALRRTSLNPVQRNPALTIMAANWAGYAASAVSLVVSARLLGASGRGAYSAILVWSMTAASVCDLSLGPALARAMTIGHRADTLRRFLPRAFAVTSLAALLVMTVFLNTFLSRSVPNRAGIAIGLSIAPALILANWGVYFFQGLADPVRYALARMLPPVICMVLILLQALDHLTLDGALASLSLGYWTVGIGSAAAALRYLRAHKGDASSMNLLGYGARAHFGTLASIANSRLDLLVLSLVVPLSEVGNYALAVSLTTPIAIVGSGLAAANFRRIGTSSSGDTAIIRSVWRRFFVPTLALACLSGSAAFLIPHIVGHEFAAAVVPTLILATGTVGFGAVGLGTNIFQARGLPGLSSLLAVAAALVSAITLLVLVPPYGIDGAAISSAVTYLLIGACCIPLTMRAYRRAGA